MRRTPTTTNPARAEFAAARPRPAAGASQVLRATIASVTTRQRWTMGHDVKRPSRPPVRPPT